MRLEHLEISGFKSFSDRSELTFDKGVTGIVGPNGCGKSNVADAITWVMGEQSAKSLRGERMEDVIFSGSDARKPTATAEVRLRFSGVLKAITGPVFPEADNGNGNGHKAHRNGNGNGHHAAVELLEAPGDAAVSDAVLAYEALAASPEAAAEELIRSVAREVEVTRRLYRSGESEYLIDGQVCRLRDVHELLMDTGLGAKAYAIIEQGKIGLILSSRPTDRRQLIEEAAGVTRYRARRRSAELKLEAAQQNLTRVDDIVFEVEKQRGSLKRQAAKARRYQKLRHEMRRWEKSLFARRYHQLAETITSARERLTEARVREQDAAARLSALEEDFGQMRSAVAESETRAAQAREAAHAREISISRQQQQLTFDREQEQTLSDRIAAFSAELDGLEARRDPARTALAARREAAAEAERERHQAAETLAGEAAEYEASQREIEGLEGDVEAARSEVFSAINAATALRHSLEYAATAHDRVAESLSELQVEAEDLRIESERITNDREAAAERLRAAQESMDATRRARQARESELASARIEHEWRARAVRSREHEIAGLTARLQSLEELEAGRAEYGDAARTVLAQANGHVQQRGAVADYLEVSPGYERAVAACLGDLLQHVIVERPEHAAAGFALVQQERAGRCGFLIASGQTFDGSGARQPAPHGLVPLTDVLGVNGPFAADIRGAIGEAWVASSYEEAAAVSGRIGAGPASTAVPIATLGGEIFRGTTLVTGGMPAEARGILETKREIRDLQQRLATEQEELTQLSDEAAALQAAAANASTAISALDAEYHRLEKTAVAAEGLVQRAVDEAGRIASKAEQVGRERRKAQEELEALERRQEESRASIVRLGGEQASADERLTDVQRQLFEAREAAQVLSQRAADAKASHAALIERAAALVADVRRLEESLTELDQRTTLLGRELDDARGRVGAISTSMVDAAARLAGDEQALDALRDDLRVLDDQAAALRVRVDADESAIKIARAAHEEVRATVGELDIARATAESDLNHLETACADAVQATLQEVLAEVAALEAAGETTADAVLIADDGDEGSDTGEEGSLVPPARDLADPGAAVLAAERQTLSAEDAIAVLRGKIERLGPVNMMAIEQHEELESRHLFLTTQRKDLVDSIAQTTEAIKRIDETTMLRFSEAFAAINRNFQDIFSTLFGGGRAGLTLLDENNPLDSGIEIVAQPPGKRLQSVQLLSGGEKALTAISLMFSLFKYKPSPFCLLDEIDAPLDDANIGRFVEMLRGMQQHTQFILITHNRKTMEIADRLYGVTMEEPGVSKLVSVQLN